MRFDRLIDFADNNNIDLNEERHDDFTRFAELLIDQNKKMNLTGITEPDQIEIKHMIDSLYGFVVIRKYFDDHFSLLDVGCGAGFPGIPLKLVFPEEKFVLLDSLKKRISFVNEVINDLKLQNIEAVAQRAEDFDRKEMFDICVSRAVAEMNVLLEYTMPFLKTGGICIFYKSGDINDEIIRSEKALTELGGKYEDTLSFELPENMGSRSLVVVRKTGHTPDKYPRRAGKPSKSPII